MVLLVGIMSLEQIFQCRFIYPVISDQFAFQQMGLDLVLPLVAEPFADGYGKAPFGSVGHFVGDHASDCPLEHSFAVAALLFELKGQAGGKFHYIFIQKRRPYFQRKMHTCPVDFY